MAMKERPSSSLSQSGEIELTESMVLTRTKAADLSKVKKLICWGSAIEDVSVVRKMPNLEVCSLSSNKITTLRDFSQCYELKELYVRMNRIDHLEDVHYLRNLKKLKSLWLSENPCAKEEDYRLAVLKALPHLQKLDNKVVTSEEIQEALENGIDVTEPADLESTCVTNSSMDQDSSTNLSTSDDYWAQPTSKRELRRKKIEEQEKLNEISDFVQTGEKINYRLTSKEIDLNNEISKDENILKSSDKYSYVETSLSESYDSFTHSQLKNFENYEDKSQVLSSDDIIIESIAGDELDYESKDENRNFNCNNSNDTTTNVDILENVSLSRESDSSSSSENKTLPISDQNDNSLVSPLETSNQTVSQENKPTSISVEEEISEFADLPGKERKQSLLDQVDLSVTETDFSDMRSSKKDLSITPASRVETEVLLERDIPSSSVTSSVVLKAGVTSKEVPTVDWEEYNRMRIEAGIEPVKTSPNVVSSTNKDTLRPTLRNSNILQAVLALVKELDKDSLDIVESAVKARLERFQNNY